MLPFRILIRALQSFNYEPSPPFIVDSIMPVTCSDIITLSAQIIGDAGDATFLWEQLSGAPIIWLEAQNQTAVMFQQPALRNDKVFRFWVNKGTPVEKYADVLVTAVPSDAMTVTIQQMATSYLVGALMQSAFISATAIEPAIKPMGSQITNDVDRTVTFVRPTSNFGTAQISLIKFDGTSEAIINQQLQTPEVVASTPRIDGFSVNGLYALRFISGATKQDSPVFSQLPPTQRNEQDLALSEIDAFRVGALVPQSVGSILEVASRTITPLNVEDSYSVNYKAMNTNSVVIEVVTRTVSQQLNDEQVSIFINILNSSSTVLENIARQRATLG